MMKVNVVVRDIYLNLEPGVWYIVENIKDKSKTAMMISPFARYDGRPDRSSDILFIDGTIDTITAIASGKYQILGKASEVTVIL